MPSNMVIDNVPSAKLQRCPWIPGRCLAWVQHPDSGSRGRHSRLGGYPPPSSHSVDTCNLLFAPWPITCSLMAVPPGSCPCIPGKLCDKSPQRLQLAHAILCAAPCRAPCLLSKHTEINIYEHPCTRGFIPFDICNKTQRWVLLLVLFYRLKRKVLVV